MGAVAPEYDPLDANKDGKVDILDVLFMLEKMMAGSGDYTLATVVKTLGQIVWHKPTEKSGTPLGAPRFFA